jgi:hypothetical protein
MSEAIERFAKYLSLSDDMLARAERDDLDSESCPCQNKVDGRNYPKYHGASIHASRCIVS